MNLNPKDKLFDFPILEVRKVVKKAMEGSLTGKNKTKISFKIATLLFIPPYSSSQLMNKLIADDYLLLTKQGKGDHEYLVLEATEKGRKFGVAKANAPITREKANQLLAELIERAKSINDNPKFAYCVSKLSVFGSYLSDTELLGDLDVFYKISQRYAGEKFSAVANQRFRIAKEKGRHFNLMIDEYVWPHQEVLLLLKTRKKGLSLHDEDGDDVYGRTQHQVVYEFDPKQ